MTTSSIIKRAALSAFGFAAYVLLIALFFNTAQNMFGNKPSFLIPAFMLTLFVFSACVTGSLVLLKPALLYVDGKKRDALRLFGWTVAMLAIYGVLLALWLFLMR